MQKRILFIFLILPAFLFAQHANVSFIGEANAKNCNMCHTTFSVEEMAKELVNAGHFKFQTDIGNDQVYVYDGDNDLSNDVAVTGSFGKANRYCGLPGAIPSIAWIGLMQNPNPPYNANNPAYPNGLPGGCSRCHVGNSSLKPNELASDAAWETIDCLLCHAATYQINGEVINDYNKRMPVADANASTGMRIPGLSGDDLSASSVTITAKPTTKNCQNCHVWGGGGYTNKRGHDFDGTYGTNPLVDIHSEKLSCVDCHITKNHKIGMGRIKPACYVNDLKDDPDNDKIACEFCHSTEGNNYYTQWEIPVPAHSSLPPKHLESVACQTCHITNNLGLDQKWFNTLVRELDANGRFIRWKPKGHKVSGQNTLLYKWFNGTVYNNVTPRGERGNGKIHPFRLNKSLVPVDDATGIMIPVKLGLIFNADSTISNLTDLGIPSGDTLALITKAIKVGAKDAIAAQPGIYDALPHDADGNYTGTYAFHDDVMNFSVDHGNTGEKRQCADCHIDQGGILDWNALGYDENPFPIVGVEDKSSLPNKFELKQNYPNPFNPSTTIEYSVAKRGHVQMRIFDVIGNLVETLVDANQAPGNYTIEFDASRYTSGVYFYEIISGNFKETKKLVLMK